MSARCAAVYHGALFHQDDLEPPARRADGRIAACQPPAEHEHVGVDLTPQIRLSPAADHHDRIEGGLDEALDVAEQPARVEGDPLEHCPDQ